MTDVKDGPAGTPGERFSTRRYAAEFGRYEGTRAAEYPASEMLVGREEERAYFLTLLHAFGRRGAFLITGHRGSGKTTFVNYCLEEYTSNVYRRYLRGNAGRAFFWDRLGHLAVALPILLLFLLISENVQELALFSWHGLLDWLMMAMLGLFCCFPLLKSKEFLEVVLDRSPKSPDARQGPWFHKPDLFSIVVLCFVGLALALAGSLGSPALAVSQLVVLAGWIYLVTNLFSFSGRLLGDDPGSEDLSYTLGSLKGRRRTWRRLTNLLLIGIGTAPMWFELGMPPDPADSEKMVKVYWLAGLCGIALGAFRRCCDQLRLGRRLRVLYRRADSASAAAAAVTASAFWHAVGSALIMSLVGAFLWANRQVLDALPSSFFAALGSGLAVLWLLATLARHRELYSLRFVAHLKRRRKARALVPLKVLLYLHAVYAALHATRGRRARAILPDSEAFGQRRRSARALLPLKVLLYLHAAQSRRARAILPFRGVVYLLSRSTLRPPSQQLAFTLHPRPRVLLGYKAFVYLAVGLQLAYPLALILTGGHPFKTPGGYQPLSSAASLFYRLHSGDQGLFGHRTDEFLWIAGLALLLCMLVLMEYEWIIRPYAMVRDDEAIYRQCQAGCAPGGRRPFPLPRNVRRRYQQLAEETFFWRTFTSWLPVLVIPVNLGFDVLEYRVVIEAMLAGLKDRYHQTFLHWSSPLVLLRRWLTGALLVGMAFYAAERWFGSRGEETERLYRFIRSAVGRDVHRMLYWRPFATAEVPREHRFLPAPDLLIYGLSGMGGDPPDPPRLGSIRVYHLLSLLGFGIVAVLLSRALPVAPYRSTYRRIERILDSLSSRLKEESRRSALMKMWSATLGGERVEGKESGPFDPRTVELAFLQVLADLQNAALHLPFTMHHRISPPLPEIIFVFDELDKLGDSPSRQVVPTPQQAPPAAREGTAEPPVDRERERADALRRLFADLKNILSSAPARFIFIGGRNLYDEWLADESARSPLMSGTFHAEIHVSSLLTDPDESDDRLNLLGIRSFLHEHWRRARGLHETWKRKIATPWLWLSVEQRRRASFTQGEAGGVESDANDFTLDLKSCATGVAWASSRYFHEAFVDFLAYKSRGNVKKLNALLESFLRPLGRFVPDPRVRRDLFDCENVLLFQDVDRFRIQLIADVFRQLLPILEQRIVYKDDKLGPGLLYLSEFLLKFHRRAFSWSNLGRVDELVHIHHSPDLRDVLEEIVLNWSEKYLHLINNGMYDYRFESQFARELEFLSHHSEQDMAAFNFTLDEAQALKGTYAAQLKLLQEPYASDLLVALGELYEFDEDFETARHHFRRAMRVLDEEFRYQAGAADDPPLSFKVEAHAAEGYEAARRVASWGVARVRLMLQVAMTYERALDVEHALIIYRDARTLATPIVHAFLGWQGDGKRVEGTSWKQAVEAQPTDFGGYLWTLKNLSILFHPIFAAAWLAEKSVAGPDTSQSLLERELWELRRELPFVSSPFGKYRRVVDPISVQHSNFALTMAELHNKAGSLYFFKGRQLVPLAKARKRVGPGGKLALKGTEGYLLKALTHYATSLHETRRFNRYRRKSSDVKLNDLENAWGTLGPRGWPEFVYRVSSGTLSNFAEALIARVSFVGLLRDLGNPRSRGKRGGAPRPEPERLFETIACWLEDTPEETPWQELITSTFPCCLGTGLDEWFGRPLKAQRRGKLLTVTTIHSDVERLVCGLVFSFAGGRLLEEAGYLAGASQEYLRVVGTISQYMWWVSLLAKVEGAEPGQNVVPGSTGGAWQEVMTAAKMPSGPGLTVLVEGLLALCCQMLDRFRRLDGRRHKTRRRNPASPDPWEKYPPPPVVTEICSLALGAAALGANLGSDLSPWVDELGRRLRDWLPTARHGDGDFSPGWFRQQLVEALDRHSYPVQNRLWGLKVLVDDSLLRELPQVLAEGRRPSELPAEAPVRATEAWLEELIELEMRYDSPLHFTPLQSGLTLATAYLAWSELTELQPRGGEGRRASRLTEDEVFRTARQRLATSQQLYTMQRSYYEMIAKLYYLYDDFNDRTIHYNQCIQMAGTELASYMIALIEARRDRAGAALTRPFDLDPGGRRMVVVRGGRRRLPRAAHTVRGAPPTPPPAGRSPAATRRG
jgi:tetratricopeptide (TPR) repeat protein